MHKLNELLEQYKHFIPERNCGYDCGDGWYEIVKECFEIMQKDCNLSDFENIPKVVQIKEKFGGLRFYVGGLSKETQDKIYAIEKKSMETCEYTGKTGELHYFSRDKNSEYGWMKTVNKEYAENYNNENNDGKFTYYKDTKHYKESHKGELKKIYEG